MDVVFRNLALFELDTNANSAPFFNTKFPSSKLQCKPGFVEVVILNQVGDHRIGIISKRTELTEFRLDFLMTTLLVSAVSFQSGF